MWLGTWGFYLAVNTLNGIDLVSLICINCNFQLLEGDLHHHRRVLLLLLTSHTNFFCVSFLQYLINDHTPSHQTLTGSGVSEGHVSRYDPSNMNRITENLADLVNDGSDSDEDITKNNNRNSIIESLEKGQKTNSNCRTRYRQVVVIVSLVGIILGSAVAIGYAIIGSGNNVQSSYLTTSNNAGAQEELEIAERVISACGETNLNKDKSECQTLCHGSMCCFENDDEYGCQDDLSKDCAVYAGCEALIEGIPLGGVDEDEK